MFTFSCYMKLYMCNTVYENRFAQGQKYIESVIQLELLIVEQSVDIERTSGLTLSLTKRFPVFRLL